MNGREEFCTTRNLVNAELIQEMLLCKEITFQHQSTPEGLLKKILELKKIDLGTNFSRKRDIVNLRFIYCKILKDTGYSLNEIGNPINRNHASVFNAIKKFNDYYETDRYFIELYHEIK
jgi:chromosomal replication initiation ATPase DnaA